MVRGGLLVILLSGSTSMTYSAEAPGLTPGLVPIPRSHQALGVRGPGRAFTARTQLYFEPVAEAGRFVARGTGYSLHLEATASTLVLAPANRSREGRLPTRSEPVAVRFRLVGADAGARGEASEELPGRSRSFRGKDPTKWRRDVPHFARVTYRQIYPGTDLTFYGNQGVLEHDFVVGPAADPSRIRLEIQGASGVRVDDAGDLVVTTAVGELRQKAPVAYQIVEGARRAVASGYTLGRTGEVAFRLGDYDRDQPLVIDPVLRYFTFLGGSDADGGQDVTVAPDGSLWIAGTTFSSDLPGAGNVWSGDQDAFVSHFTANGQALLSTTYVGGTSAEFANRVKATGSGVYVVGGTVSADFPSPDAACAVCRNPPSGLQPWEIFNPPSDAQSFLVKLDAFGDLQHAVVYGGDALDNAWVLGLDAVGRVHVGSTSCGDGFPTTPGAYRQARTPATDASDLNNECDVAVARFRETPAGFVLRYGSYLGGSGADFVAGLAVTPAGADWVVGGTTSGDFPTTATARQTAIGGDFDAFVTRLTVGGGTLGYSTYLGGSAYDYPLDIALGVAGSAYVTGRTESANFPTTRGAFQQTSAGGSDGFVARFNGAGSLAWSTRLGGTGFDWPFAIVVGSTGAAYVAGQTNSPDFPTLLPIQGGPGGANDAFVTKIASTGRRLLWSTLLGGPDVDQAHGLALDGHRGVWIAGTTAGGLTPTGDAVQPVFGGGSTDGFLAGIDESASIRVLLHR
jgi:beta-propeller repeat-containing protein